MSQELAHDIEKIKRTEDVQTTENVEFTAMLLSDPILQGLHKHGFKKPSPIQLKAIPIGRCGFDLIIKSKSGTGKTAVFGIIALEMIDVTLDALQVLILAPTREIAVQIQQVLLTIGCFIQGLKVEYFIGGTLLVQDYKKLQKCHIAVGAPGRVKHLIKHGNMELDSVRLFILDEADKLMGTSFQKNVNYIYNKLAEKKQIIASSATYPEELNTFLTKYMISPCEINATTQIPVLLGLKQFVSEIKSHLNIIQEINNRNKALLSILESISFNQCIIFSNYQTRAETLANTLTMLDWPAIFVSGAQAQQKRLEAVQSLKDFKCRILSTTDLVSRGIDAANVDLVINYEVPYDTETYLHRMGRAGRYGSKGICVTIADDGEDLKRLQYIIETFEVYRFPKPDQISGDFWSATDFEKFLINKETMQVITEMGSKKRNDTEVSELIATQNSENCTESEQKSDSIKVKNLNNYEINSDTLTDTPKLTESICSTLNKLTVSSDNISNETGFLAQRSELENVENMLLNIESEDEIHKTDVILKFGHLNSSSIIDILSKGDLDENIKKSKTKKIKTTQNPNTNLDDTKTNSETDTNSQFETEATNFQNTSILNKNIALYNLTNFIVNDNAPISIDSISSIDNLLTIIDQEDKITNPKFDPNNLVARMLNLEPTNKNFTLVDRSNLVAESNLAPRNIDSEFQNTAENMIIGPEQSCNLDSSSKLKNSINPQEPLKLGTTNSIFDKMINEDADIECNNLKSTKLRKIRPKIENVLKQLKCGCPENLFEIAFENALSENLVDWSALLCKTHFEIKLVEDTAELNCDAIMEEPYNDDDEMESFYLNDNETDKKYDENIFEKAYEYALQDKPEFDDTKSVHFNSEATGYASGYNKPSTNYLEVNQYGSKSKEALVSSSDLVDNYEAQYDYCSNILSGSGPYFSDTDSFEKWHQKWQENLNAVRNFIQQDIFTKEVLRKRKNT